MSDHKSLAEALAAFQGEAPKLHKGETAQAGSYSYKYVDLADIVAVIQPLMKEHGLSWSTFPCIGSDGRPALRYALRHTSGDMESDTMPLMLAKADAQGLGSAISYGRRYALCAVLNLVADADDDGAAATAAARQPRRQASQLPAGMVNQLRQAYVETGWDVPTLHKRLEQFGANGVEDLNADQARELLTIMSNEIDARVPA